MSPFNKVVEQIPQYECVIRDVNINPRVDHSNTLQLLRPRRLSNPHSRPGTGHG